MGDKLKIGESTRVTLNFSLELDSGEKVDSNFGETAPTFTFGDGSLLPGFEQALVGLEAGDVRSFTIPPEDGFGQHNPSNIQTVDRKNFDPDIIIERGLVVSFADPSGGELPGVVHDFNDNEVTMDFNHPLAGRSVIFTVDIKEVSPSVKH